MVLKMLPNIPSTTLFILLIKACTSMPLDCPETKPAPSTISRAGLVSQGMMMEIKDSSTMPAECGPVFFSGDTDIFQVPDKCCTAEVGAEPLIPFGQFGSYKGIEGCFALDPFQDGNITAVLVNGCYDDGTQFYGEKCGGSNFKGASARAYGECGPAEKDCECNLYVESKSPGCFSIASPETIPQRAVFAKMEGCTKECAETRPAPSTVSKAGLVSQGKMMRIPDASTMPDECGPIFFSGNTDIFQVPDKCCSAEVGAEDWIPLDEFGSYEGIDGCYALDPFQNGAITAILVNGCYDDGTQFYGEKCGGSNFGAANGLAYGDCGPAEETCACKLYVESKSPGCFAIATPEADPQLAVFLKMEGCSGEAASDIATECKTVPLSPPTNQGDMVPDGALVFYTDARQVDTNVCGEPCFSENCYGQVPMECCDKADNQYFSMDALFTGKTCSGPVEVTDDLTVYVAGGCSLDGTFFYGEMCGGSNFGAFKELSDGTPLNLGVCNQPETICKCNAYVQTQTAGCFTVGTPLGAAEQYFMKVNDPVCKTRQVTSQVSSQNNVVSNAPTPFTPCKSRFHNCDGVFDGSGRCVCGSEVRTLLFQGTFRDQDCTDSLQELPQLPIAMDACFHYPLPNGTMYSIMVSCLKDEIGANFRMWNSLDCKSNKVAEVNTYPGKCVLGELESYVRGFDTWVIDDTCSDAAISRSRRPVSRRPTIAAAATATNSLSTLVTAVKAANLAETLDSDGSYTAFAPNNDAFARVPENVLVWLLKPENSDELRSILLRHLLPTINMAEVIPDGTQEVKTVGGDMITTKKSANGVIIDSNGSKANVIATNTFTHNGIVHVIDNVLWLHRMVNAPDTDCDNDILCLPKDINVDDLEFSPTVLDGLEVSPLKGNPFNEAALFAAKFSPGARNPLHVHTYQYEAAIWKGQFKHYIPDVDENDRNLKIFNVGEAYSIPAGQVHQDINVSDTEPVILLIYFHGPFDVTPVDTKPK